AIDENGTCIRANQGHSAPVDLELQPVLPPAVLYHGTGRGNVAAILQSGLKKKGRPHLHPSPAPPTATKGGAAAGRPGGRGRGAPSIARPTASGWWTTCRGSTCALPTDKGQGGNDDQAVAPGRRAGLERGPRHGRPLRAAGPSHLHADAGRPRPQCRRLPLD